VRSLRRAPGHRRLPVLLWDDVRGGEVLFALRGQGRPGRNRRRQAGIVSALRVEMNAVVVGGSNLRECPRCEGIWADADTLHQICEDKESSPRCWGWPRMWRRRTRWSWRPTSITSRVRCGGELMNRVNFAHCSHVIVNVCAKHGTWFDRDELRRMVEFIRAGGLENARAQEIADLDRERRAAEWHAAAGNLDFGSTFSPGRKYDLLNLGISAAAGFLSALIRSKW